MSTVKVVYDRLSQVPGVTRLNERSPLRFEVTPEICEKIASILGLPASASLGIPQFIGVLCSKGVHPDEEVESGRLVQRVSLGYRDIFRLIA
jgi:hypothetical protein